MAQLSQDLTQWQTRPVPQRANITGDLVRLEPINAQRHTASLFAATRLQPGGAGLWTYLPDAPPNNQEDFKAHLYKREQSSDPLHYAVVDQSTGKAVGSVAYMRITPEHGVIEIGHVLFGPILQRTRAATEVIFLLLRHAFDYLGYRRVEWKCDSLNEPSRRAALRFGFQYEGLFRQHIVVKGRNRDTTWFSIIDKEWPLVRAAFEQWLDPANFDAEGQQIRSLKTIRDSRKAENH